MSLAAHEYAVMLERVMCFGVLVEELTKQERLDRKGKKPTSRHVPSGSFRVSLNPGGSLPLQNPDHNTPVGQFIEHERVKLKGALQEALRPLRDRLASQFKSIIESAKDTAAVREAVMISTMIKDMDGMQVIMSCPSSGDPSLSLTGSVVVAGPEARSLQEELRSAMERVLGPPREAGVVYVRRLAMQAIG